MSNRRGNLPVALSFSSEREFLCVRHLPSRLCPWQTAALGGFEPQHMPILVAARLIHPLGNPPPNAPKYFARDYVLSLFADERWLERASDALVQHWATRNAKKAKFKKPAKN